MGLTADEQRQQMVEFQLRRRGIADERVLKAMGVVPREAFVPEHLTDVAYEDGPLSIGGGQTISQPYIVATMLEAADIAPGARLLDVGTGSGYAAAVCAAMGAKVHSIERDATLGEAARTRLADLGYAVDVTIGDGTKGLPEHAPYDVILAAAAAPTVPQALKDQLAPGGRLVLPVGAPGAPQELRRIVRSEPGFEDELLTLVAFVPLVAG